MSGQTVHTRQSADPLAAVFLRRLALVSPGLLNGGTVKVQPRKQRATVAEGLLALEADALARGYLLGPALRAHLAALPVERLAGLGLALLGAPDGQVGADVAHVPLFRTFPREIPEDTYALYVGRVFAVLLQEPAQPCVLCGEVGVVRPVAPCAHLVCALDAATVTRLTASDLVAALPS